jgi:hypothetical protein
VNYNVRVLNLDRSDNEKVHKVNGFRCHALSLESHGILKNIHSGNIQSLRCLAGNIMVDTTSVNASYKATVSALSLLCKLDFSSSFWSHL